VDVLAGEIVCVFAHIESADEDGARKFKPLDERGIPPSRLILAIDLGAGERGKSGNIEQILDRERHTRQWAKRFAVRTRLVERMSAINSALVGNRGKAIEQRVVVADAGEGCFNNLKRPDATPAASWPAALQARSSGAGGSSIKDRRRLDVICKREFVDEFSMQQDQSQIECDCLMPCRVQGNTQCLRIDGDERVEIGRAAAADPRGEPRS
jgi:hypothetical protein